MPQLYLLIDDKFYLWDYNPYERVEILYPYPDIAFGYAISK